MIPKINKILYATDLSKNAAYVFRYAINTAEKHDAEIIILHAIEEMPSRLQAHGITRDIKVLEDGAIEELRRRLDEFCKEELQDRPESMKRITEIEVKEGYPAEVILRTAEDENCDVIIMGSHGKGILTHTFLGSVAERVLRRSRKPVFIIPFPEK